MLWRSPDSGHRSFHQWHLWGRTMALCGIKRDASLIPQSSCTQHSNGSRKSKNEQIKWKWNFHIEWFESDGRLRRFPSFELLAPSTTSMRQIIISRKELVSKFHYAAYFHRIFSIHFFGVSARKCIFDVVVEFNSHTLAHRIRFLHRFIGTHPLPHT